MMLKKLMLSALIIMGIFICTLTSLKSLNSFSILAEPDIAEERFHSLYKNLQEPDLNYNGFKTAIAGFNVVVTRNNDISKNMLTFIDYSKPSTEKRLFVIDLDNHMIVYKTFVAHGRNTGLNYAETFSNQCQSHKSSLGFYITRNTYTGRHGYSLRLEGIEEGINDNALKRAIVMHPADYVSTHYIDKYGRLGRSYGCPSIPLENHKYLIDLIKDNTCLFAYYPDSQYLSSSGYLR